MNVTLKPELEKLVTDKVKRGDYDTPEALVDFAVQRLLEEEEEEDAHLEEIRVRTGAAEAAIDRGEFVEYDERTIQNLAGDVHERGLKRLTTGADKTDTRG